MFTKEKKEKKDKNKEKLVTLEKAKICALFVPVVSSIILLLNSLKSLIPPYIGHVDENTTVVVNKIMSVDNNIGFGLTILGIAVTVWIGLSIYNAIEKREVDEVKRLQKELENKIKKQGNNQEYLEVLSEWLSIYHMKMVSLSNFKKEIDDEGIENIDIEYVSLYLKRYTDCFNTFDKLLKTDIEKSATWLPLQLELLMLHLNVYRLISNKDISRFETHIYEILVNIDNILNKEIFIYNSKDIDKIIKQDWKDCLNNQFSDIDEMRDYYFTYVTNNELIKILFNNMIAKLADTLELREPNE